MEDEHMRPTRKYTNPRESRHRDETPDNTIKGIIEDIERKLADSLKPEALRALNSFERKLVHRHFDHNRDFETRTYRDGDTYTLYVYPVGNLKRLAREKAEESLQTGADVELPPMGSYERYIVHTEIQEIAGVETESVGEGKDRRVKIISKKFGRGLKKIVKKIKLF